MHSFADIVDKLIIENIKIFSIRESLHSKISDKEFVECENKMNILNANRAQLMIFLDKKVDDIKNGKPNRFLNDVKTYAKKT